MKKVWNDATLEELDITATAGGPIENNVEDLESYQQPDGWYHRTGTTPDVSVADIQK